MRINRFVALATGVGRRQADAYITDDRVRVNERAVEPGYIVKSTDVVTLDGKRLTVQETTTIMLHKPVGYVCSRNGQGSPTIYQLLPRHYQQLKPVGRLDKDSSGLLLLTNDGKLAHSLTHPSQQKEKTYQVRLDKPLSEADRQTIIKGVRLSDGLSKLELAGQNYTWQVKMYEGRNRQIRRTFARLGYSVMALHRTNFGQYALGKLPQGAHTEV